MRRTATLSAWRPGQNARRRIVFYGTLSGVIAGAVVFCTAMPGRSFVGSPPLDAREARIEIQVRRDVGVLGGAIGERNTRLPAKLHATADYIGAALADASYTVKRHAYTVDLTPSETIDADLTGTASTEIVLVGAHYDSARGAPGADDNASGTAAVLALARALAGHSLRRTVRFALFPNEEPPYFAGESMGSLVYAREVLARGDVIVAMLSLESIGYFSDAPGSQRYPGAVALLYPDRGNFVAFVGDVGARPLVRDAIGVFRKSAHIPSEGGALPAFVPGVDWSDQRSFRGLGVPAIMVTDTATFRNPGYHHAADTPETVDSKSLARVVAGMVDVVTDLATR